MKFHKYLSAALIAGSASLWLMNNTATAQVSVPKVNKTQNATDANSKSKTNVDAKAKANTQVRPNTDVDDKAKAGTDAQIRNNANVDGKAGVDSKADINGDTDIRGNAGVDSDAGVRGNADLQADSDLGWEFDESSDDSLTLSSVSENGIAAQAGLRAGDQILSVNRQRFTSNADLNDFLARQHGQRIPLTYLRNGQRHSIMITPRAGVAVRRNRGWQAARPMVLGTTFVGNSRGVVVNEVYENSPAYQAGLRAGDEIVCFNGWSYRDADQFTSWMNRFPRGRSLPMTYRRDGRMYSTRVTLADQIAEGFARADRSDRLPPAPQGEFEGRELPGRDYAQGEFQGRRRTALRPNFDEMTREQLQQEVKQLRQENKSLRQDLDSLRGAAPASLDSEIDVESETNLNSTTEIESETEIDDGNTIKSETEVETEEPETDFESKTRLPKTTPKQEHLDTPLDR